MASFCETKLLYETPSSLDYNESNFLGLGCFCLNEDCKVPTWFEYMSEVCKEGIESVQSFDFFFFFFFFFLQQEL